MRASLTSKRVREAASIGALVRNHTGTAEAANASHLICCRSTLPERLKRTTRLAAEAKKRKKNSARYTGSRRSETGLNASIPSGLTKSTSGISPGLNAKNAAPVTQENRARHTTHLQRRET